MQRLCVKLRAVAVAKLLLFQQLNYLVRYPFVKQAQLCFANGGLLVGASEVLLGLESKASALCSVQLAKQAGSVSIVAVYFIKQIVGKGCRL